MPAVGFAVECEAPPQGAGSPGWWDYTGDTGPNPLLWERLREMRVAHLIIETAFSDEERQLARISRHLCPAALGHEAAQLAGSIDAQITHIEPGEVEALMVEIGRLGTPHRIHPMTAGQAMDLGLKAQRKGSLRVGWRQAHAMSLRDERLSLMVWAVRAGER